MADQEFKDSEQIIFFVDLLGSSALVQSADREKVGLLTKMLHGVSQAQSNFGITRVDQKSLIRNKIVFAMPAISTFSDHVLISFRIDEMAAEMTAPFNEAFWVAQTLIGRLALDALQIGFLIRGGATLNSLYHHNGTVVGKGLLEAYELERSVAHYPRIAVSRKLYSKGNFEEILTDDDGVKHFDYMSEMLRLISEPKQLSAVIDRARKNVADFEERERWNEMSKWSWFLKKIEEEERNRTL